MSVENAAGERHHIKDAGTVPVVWPFKVEWMEHVGPEGLEKWEKAMREHVGIEVEGLRAVKPGCATISGSAYGWDDCDYWGNGC